jgi:membrane protein implicated in regulation of membrane protease activity
MLNFLKRFTNLFSKSPECTPEPSDDQAPLTLNPEYVGGEAVVDETIQPGRVGRVQFQGSCWYARCDQEVVLVRGRTVKVTGIRNITLLVESMPTG